MSDEDVELFGGWDGVPRVEGPTRLSEFLDVLVPRRIAGTDGFGQRMGTVDARPVLAARRPAPELVVLDTSRLNDDGRGTEMNTIAGQQNPIGPRVRYRLEPTEWPAVDGIPGHLVKTEEPVTFSLEHCGFPGVVHGGCWINGVLDDLMARCAALLGYWCVTDEITTRYRIPIPVGVPVHFEGSLVSRNHRTVARAFLPGRHLAAESTGKWAPMPRSVERRVLKELGGDTVYA